MKTPTSVVFDVGNVLFAYDPSRIVQSLLPNSVYHDLFLTHLFGAEVWQQLDRGDLTTQQAVSQLSNTHGPKHQSSFERCITGFADHLEPMPTSIHWFKKLQAELPVYILSNFQNEPFDQLTARHPFLRTASGAVVSAKVGYKKPEPEIFDILMTQYRLDPSQTLFIDDMADNIQAAQAKGFQTHHYQSADQLDQDLSKRFS